MDFIKIESSDNVCIVLQSEGFFDGKVSIPFGHKVADQNILKDQPIIKSGQTIGFATEYILKGSHVHTHNMRNPEGSEIRPFKEKQKNLQDMKSISLSRSHFMGYPRENGDVGIRNYIIVVSTVNCSSTVVKRVCRYLEDKNLRSDIDAVIPVTHTQGCAQAINGAGHTILNRTLSGWMKNPNVVGVVLIGLGCEGTKLQTLKPFLQSYNKPSISFDIQEIGGTEKAINYGIEAVYSILEKIQISNRVLCPIAKLKIALNCGGSDGLSAITTNPALGKASDILIQYGGTAVLAEIPECNGAEDMLVSRSINTEVANQVKNCFRWWDEHTKKRNVNYNNNLSPGNIKGGISTIVEKSLGAVAKAGQSSLNGFVDYSCEINDPGFILMNTPGFDPVSVTGLVAGGCQIVAFTTGRDSTYGCSIAPTLKISTNSELARRMSDDIDIDAGLVLSGSTIERIGEDIFNLFIEVASGQKTKSEKLTIGNEEFVPWLVGETL